MSISNFVPEIFSKKLGKSLDNKGVMMQCVNRDWEGEIKSKGDTVNIITPGNISVKKYGGVVTSEKPSSSNQQLLIDQADYFSFQVSKIEEAQSQEDLIKIYSERASIAVELARDSYLQGMVAYAHANNVISTSVVTKHNIYDKFVGAYEKLGTANALNSGKTPFIIIDFVLRSLIVENDYFVQATDLGDKVVRKGAIGQFAGFDVLVSTNFSASSGTYNVMYGTDEAITYASQVVDMEKDKKDFVTTVQGLYVYGAKVVLDKALGNLVLTLS